MLRIRKLNGMEVMTTHTSKKLFGCDICGKRFSQKYRLDMHRVTHTSEEPFQCNICGRSFERKSTWQRHLYDHKGDDIPHNGQRRGEKFWQKASIDAHVKENKCYISNVGQQLPTKHIATGESHLPTPSMTLISSHRRLFGPHKWTRI